MVLAAAGTSGSRDSHDTPGSRNPGFCRTFRTYFAPEEPQFGPGPDYDVRDASRLNPRIVRRGGFMERGLVATTSGDGTNAVSAGRECYGSEGASQPDGERREIYHFARPVPDGAVSHRHSESSAAALRSEIRRSRSGGPDPGCGRPFLWSKPGAGRGPSRPWASRRSAAGGNGGSCGNGGFTGHSAAAVPDYRSSRGLAVSLHDGHGHAAASGMSADKSEAYGLSHTWPI